MDQLTYRSHRRVIRSDIQRIIKESRNVALLSLYYCYYIGHCSSKLLPTSPSSPFFLSSILPTSPFTPHLPAPYLQTTSKGPIHMLLFVLSFVFLCYYTGHCSLELSECMFPPLRKARNTRLMCFMVSIKCIYQLRLHTVVRNLLWDKCE